MFLESVISCYFSTGVVNKETWASGLSSDMCMNKSLNSFHRNFYPVPTVCKIFNSRFPVNLV